jgi:multicomponent Na+:H+ antiporter subunit E
MATKQRRLKIQPGFIWLAVLLTFLWLSANSSFAPEALATGALISAVLAYVFTRKRLQYWPVFFDQGLMGETICS